MLEGDPCWHPRPRVDRRVFHAVRHQEGVRVPQVRQQPAHVLPPLGQPGRVHVQQEEGRRKAENIVFVWW